MLTWTAVCSSIAALIWHTLTPSNDFVVPAGQTVDFDTTSGQPLIADHVLIDGTLHVQGPYAFHLQAKLRLRVAGTIDVSGFGAPGVVTLNTTSIPEPGASGQAGGGVGGTGNLLTTQSTAKGGDGSGGYNAPGLGGRGGGAGGNASFPNGQLFPAVPFDPLGDEKGSGGGGGGGIALISARVIEIVGSGAIHVDGGQGGGGENTFCLNRVGGGSGGGSGGFLVLQALSIDLSHAQSNCLTASAVAAGRARSTPSARRAPEATEVRE